MAELSEIFKELSEIKAKNQRYEYNREKLEKSVSEIKSKITEIIKILDEIDPKVDISVKNRSGIKMNEVAYWFMQKLQEGQKIGINDLKMAFPNSPPYIWNNLTQGYAKAKGWKLQHEKEGRGYRYFI